ncbi:MAG: hypothetical protein MUO82_02215 [Candidatus Thermoplasmatota archaeon]|nr:hypothetical protein [Candidatus Thermoplasmatota archaeon]
MRKNIPKILIFLSFVILIFYSPTSSAKIPTFDIVICSDITRINPGDNITFNIFLVGAGNVSADYLLCYVNGDIRVTKVTVLGKNYVEGLANQGTNAQLFPLNIIPQVIPPKDYQFGELHPLWGVNESKKSAITVTISTTNETPSGEHDLKIIYLYKGEDNVWKEASDTMTFHITTEAEQIEYEALLQNVIQPILNFLVAFAIFTFGIIFAKFETIIRHQRLLKKLYTIIKNEIESNKGKARKLSSTPANAVPSNRMEISNKEAFWSKIIEYEDKNYDLLNNISNLYDKYGLLNRTIDSGFTYLAANNTVPPGLSGEIKRICDVIEEETKKIIERFT